MNDKIYPTNKIIIKKPDDIIAFDYVTPAAQQIFNYIVAKAIKNNKETVIFTAKDFFFWLNKKRPQGSDYNALYRNLELLKYSFVIANKIENDKKIKYEWPLIAETKTIRTFRNRIESIEIKLNPYLLNYYRWQRANVPIDINITKYLTAKYAYKLYEYISYQQRKNAKNNYIGIDDLRRILTVPKNEKNERFIKYLSKALQNINMTTELKIQAKIKTKNKKALMSAEIKFINLTSQIAQTQYEFLLFERKYNSKKGE